MNILGVVEWISHYKQYEDGIPVFDYKDGRVNILVHPNMPRVEIDLGISILAQVGKEAKSAQMYLFSFVFFLYAKEKRDYDILSKLITEIQDELKLRKSHGGMAWDDHAVSERSCVLVYILSSISFLAENDRNLISNHLSCCQTKIDCFVDSDKWSGNNHRVFHLMAAISISLHSNLIGKAEGYAEDLDQFFFHLFDLDTGFSLEQSVSYLSFDIQLLGRVSASLELLNLTMPNMEFQSIRNLYNYHLASLAFPDGTLPSSGDTPLGLKAKILDVREAHQNFELLKAAWKRLDNIGYIRSCSPNKLFHCNLLTHNGDSFHGHFSPLHFDMWIHGVGQLFIDSGGPYIYGDKLRYEWFRSSLGHNVLTLLDAPVGKSQTLNLSGKRTPFGIMGVYSTDLSTHSRVIELGDDHAAVSDVLYLRSESLLSFHIAPGFDLRIQNSTNDGDFNSYRLQCDNSELGLMLSISILTNGKLNIKNTLRCIGGRQTVTCPSFVIAFSCEFGYSKVNIKI